MRVQMELVNVLLKDHEQNIVQHVPSSPSSSLHILCVTIPSSPNRTLVAEVVLRLYTTTISTRNKLSSTENEFYTFLDLYVV